MKRLLAPLASIFILFFAACSINDDSPNFKYEPLKVVKAVLPDTFNFNEVYDIDVTYEIPDDCSSFSGFDVQKRDTTVRNVAAFATVRTDKDTCIQKITEHTNSFEFKILFKKEYTFRFWQGEDSEGNAEYLEVIVPVKP